MRLSSESSFDEAHSLSESDNGLFFQKLSKSSAVNTQIKEKKNHRKRLDSLDSIDEQGEPRVTIFSVAMSLVRRKELGKPLPLPFRPKNRATLHWLKALHLTRHSIDPWKSQFGELLAEKAVRHQYNALAKTWKTEKVLVKMEKTSFAAGAMRECFRLKKLSNFSHSQDWTKDSNNYVAKSYMDSTVARNTYYEDVKLQMDAKLWGEEYNRHNPPKKVDIFMMTVLEMVDRPGQPLFHIEHYIDGEYVKYNSNSGYVDNRVARQTPHAFSHFTFERSGHELIVVDVQGVGDLYTDPQIHTAEGHDYGDGNLGVKGMALFFHSHSCSAICKGLGLEKFDLAPRETDEIRSSKIASKSQTLLRGHEVVCASPSESDRADHFENFFRNRCNSVDLTRSMSCTSSSSYQEMDDSNVFDEDTNDSFNDEKEIVMRRRRLTTECSVNEQDIKSFQDNLERIAKPSNLSAELLTQFNHDDSILGQVHLALAKYHECYRFGNTDGTYDREAALFHLKAAAECGIVAAIVALARIYCGLPHDILSDVIGADDPLPEPERVKRGLTFMETAARTMDRSAMVFMAQAYELGINGANHNPDQALYWYESIIALDEDEGGDTEEMSFKYPPYVMVAKSAELWYSGVLKQGRNPKKAGELFNQAAEIAMSSMKGKLANKYYTLAEEAWGRAEE